MASGVVYASAWEVTILSLIAVVGGEAQTERCVEGVGEREPEGEEECEGCGGGDRENVRHWGEALGESMNVEYAMVGRKGMGA